MNVSPETAGSFTMTPPPYCRTNQPFSGSSNSAAANSITAWCPWNRTRSPLRISSPDKYRKGSNILQPNRVSTRALHPDYRDLRKALFKQRRLQLVGHLPHHVFAH